MEEKLLLHCLVQVIGRVAVPESQVRSVVGSGKNRVKAFNLCDGEMSLQDVARKTKIDSGNLSRAAAVWVNEGIAFKIGEGRSARILHLYPIPLKPKKPSAESSR